MPTSRKPQVNRVKVRDLRRTRGFTLREAADLADTNAGTWHDIESGRRDPSQLLLDRMAKTLGVKAEALVHGGKQ